MDSSKGRIGLATEKHQTCAKISFVGKESNKLEEVDAELIHLAENVYRLPGPGVRLFFGKNNQTESTENNSVVVSDERKQNCLGEMLIKARQGKVKPPLVWIIGLVLPAPFVVKWTDEVLQQSRPLPDHTQTGC